MDTLRVMSVWENDIVRGDYTDEEKRYAKNSWRRFAFVLERVEECAALKGSSQDGTNLSILDIGPHFFTALLRKRFPAATINSIGYYNQLCTSATVNKHIEFDLANTQFPERWPAPMEHDIVVMGEVIEHLYTAPWLVLRFVKSLMSKNGFLVLSTPNAVDIIKRLNILRGRNPYEMLRECLHNPGHIREYTLRELTEIGSKAGLKVRTTYLANYFPANTALGDILYTSTYAFPWLRNGITIVFQA
jgi:hypothetical protein